jgi:membrane protein YqaA with SNARE-associated domain
MIVFWKGWGWLVAVLFIGPLMLTQLLVDAVAGRGTYSQHANTFGTVAALLGAVMVWLLGRRLNERDSPGATSNFQVAHTFMFLRMEYWAVLFLGFAVLNIVT